jgi:[ribosomal protein S5]-alanine N-acetyltransferase
VSLDPQVPPLTTRIETSRLELLAPSLITVEQVQAFFQRNRTFLTPWNPQFSDQFFRLDMQRLRLEQECTLWRQGRQLRFYLRPRNTEAGNRIIGHLGFSNIVRGALQSCHLGYAVDQDAQGQGYMAEALQAAIRFAFDQIRLYRIEANIMPANQRSRRLAQRLGFVEEGYARRYLKINGVWEDHIHYVLLNSDPAI